MSDEGHEGYCTTAEGAKPPKADGPPYAECVLCREPTEYPESYRGITMCPRCWGSPPLERSREWGRQEAQRTACSG
ncbi:hypothetical protein ACIQVK_15265 [Streptomyces sp. NPDC090493]|uniref:hypothetical protein n=1 Tax=Streptomyces sp. NPDC090493 TaxID=3365964 RepID=UPI00380D816A